MCLLCVIEPNETPTRQQLMNAADSNPHGYGYAFMNDGVIITGRGMDAEDVIDRFLRIRQGLPHAWAMFHARFTTHGETNKSNCHPFRVGGSKNIVLGHNGVLPIDTGTDKRSDTRIFAEEWLPEIGVEALDDPTTYGWLEKWAAGSKIAVFSTDPRTKQDVYILNEHLGHWDKGIWWSNSSYKDDYWGSWASASWKPSKQKSVLAGCSLDSMGDSYECDFCRSFLCYADNGKPQYCYNCMTCFSCFEDVQDCLCYGSPAKEDYETEEICYACLDSVFDCTCAKRKAQEEKEWGSWDNVPLTASLAHLKFDEGDSVIDSMGRTWEVKNGIWQQVVPF